MAEETDGVTSRLLNEVTRIALRAQWPELAEHLNWRGFQLVVAKSTARVLRQL